MSYGVRVQVPSLALKSFLTELSTHSVETIFILQYNGVSQIGAFIIKLQLKGCGMKILITVNYLVDTDRDNFWEAKSGYLKDEIDAKLKERFPEKMKLSNTIYGQRYSLIHEPIDHPNANLIICPICKRLLTDRKKPKPIEELDNVAELANVLMCKNCAWELEKDVEVHGIESVIDRFKK